MFSILRTGLDAANKDLAVISNNIANAGTNGFKKSEAQFEDMYHSHHNRSQEVARGIGVKTINIKFEKFDPFLNINLLCLNSDLSNLRFVN